MPIWFRCKSFVRALSFLALLCCGTLGAVWGASEGAVTTLQFFTHVAPASSLSVTSTLVYGPTEAILIDAQMSTNEAAALAGQIAATGRKLKAIFITHPDEDHYLGTAVLHRRFPATPIYMTAKALANFQKTSERKIAGAKGLLGADASDTVPTPELLPSTHLLVDGQALEVIPDLQGDVLEPTNSFVWIPSLRTVIAGDIAFNFVHVYLADSTEETRQRWQDSLKRMQSLDPRVVVAGHKKSADMGDSPHVLTATSEYLRAFETARKSAADASALVDSMKQTYADYGLEVILAYSAKKTFQK
jgi:glyoxylase-like metal-dependent hydrolase (beta-lactamase superfamily II)